MSGVSGLWISRPQSNSRTTADESRSRDSSNSTRRRRSSGSELPLIEEHHGPVRTPLPVDEAGALVEPARRLVVLAGAHLHLLGPLATRGLNRRLEQGAAEAVASQVGDDVELLEVGVKPRRVDPWPEAELR